MKRDLIALFSGMAFGVGLLLAGMTNPAKIKGFLDIAGTWDPSLVIVMGSAMTVSMLGFALARRRGRSWSGDPIDIPANRSIDVRLVLGGIIFGAGWGLGGLCPGPAVVAMGTGLIGAWIFGSAMVAGMLVHDRFLRPR